MENGALSPSPSASPSERGGGAGAGVESVAAVDVERQSSGLTNGGEVFDEAPFSPSFLPIKYLVVTGGTMSGLGKGTTISSIGEVTQNEPCQKSTCLAALLFISSMKRER